MPGTVARLAPGGGYVLAIPIALGLLFNWLWDFGDAIEPQLYATVGEVAPVIAIATLAALFFAVRPILYLLETHRRDPHSMRMELAPNLTRELGLFLIAESAALIGVALGHSTTFLAVTMLAALLGMVISFFRWQYDYFVMGVLVTLPGFGKDVIPGSRDRKEGSGKGGRRPGREPRV